MKFLDLLPQTSRLSIVFILLLAFQLTGCGGGGGSGGGGSGTTSFNLAGQAQKGPFAIGAQISVNELDNNLNPTGKVYNVQTTDNLGNFSVSSNIGTKLVEIVGSGYYMDELTGQLSTGQITLRAVVDLSMNPHPTLNILTTLQEQRLKALVTQGQTYTAANAQSQSEVLAIFGIDSMRINSPSTFYSMKIDGGTDNDSVLLAASTILSQMATDAAATNATSQPTELSNYVNTIAAGLASTGTYTNSAFITARNLAETQLSVSAIKNNLVTYYANHGVTMVPPSFEEWVDQSNSGILPQRLVPVVGLVFNNVTAAQPFQINTSNSVTVSGLGGGVVAPVSVNTGTTLIKNGVTLSSIYATVQNGDTIALQITSGASSSIKTATLHVGASTYTWSVTTTTPIVNVAYGLLPSGPTIANYGGNTTDTSMYFAFPIVPANSFVASNVGVGLFYGQTPPAGATIGIYSDNASQPSVPLASSSMGTYIGGSTLSSVNGTSYTLPSNGISEASFGNSGVSLTANTPYWVVVKFPSAVIAGIVWQGVNGYLTGACVPGANCPQPPMPSTPTPRVTMKSADGITWTSITGYQGVVGTSNATVMPFVYLTN